MARVGVTLPAYRLVAGLAVGLYQVQHPQGAFGDLRWKGFIATTSSSMEVLAFAEICSYRMCHGSELLSSKCVWTRPASARSDAVIPPENGVLRPVMERS